jgi:Leucine-rich repeat (LRR) protein
LDAPVPYLEGIRTKLSDHDSSVSVIEEINLSGFGCRGDYANLGFDYPECRRIDLSFNCIRGSIPLPLEGLPLLVHLDLNANQLSIDISTMQFSSVPLLTYLNLSHNKFSGSCVASFKSNVYLETIDLSNNRLCGPLPAITSSSLLKLNVANNRFEGRIPSSYSALVNLQEFVVSCNVLEDDDLGVCWSMTSLRILVANDNLIR